MNANRVDNLLGIGSQFFRLSSRPGIALRIKEEKRYGGVQEETLQHVETDAVVVFLHQPLVCLCQTGFPYILDLETGALQQVGKVVVARVGKTLFLRTVYASERGAGKASP